MREIYIKIEGLNLYRIAQKLIDQGVFLSNFKLKKTYILFSIDERYKTKLDKICKQEHKKYYIVKDTSIKRFFAKLPHLIGAFIPFCILFAVFYVFSNTIFELNISAVGQNSIDIENVRQLLYNNNIKIGENKNKLSSKEIEKIIMQNAEGVAGCEIFYEGRKLNIVLFSETKKPEISNTNLLSKYNAIVTEIEVFVGLENVKIGDLVKEGDILIKSDGGAQGEIRGKVYFSATQIYNEKQEYFEETGNEFWSGNYSVFSIFDIGKPQECPYKNFKLEVVEKSAIKNLFIPINYKQFIYREVETKEKVIPFSEVEQTIKEDLKCEVLKRLPEGTVGENVTYSIVKEGSYVRVDCFVECEISLI